MTKKKKPSSNERSSGTRRPSRKADTCRQSHPVTARSAGKACSPPVAKSSAPHKPGSAALSPKALGVFKDLLLAMRKRLSGQMNALKNDSLESVDWLNLEEDGTDIFERQFALNIVSSENEMLQEIDDALERVEEGTYGICQSCNGPIGEARLKALPFVKTCVVCQSKMEKGPSRIRPASLFE